MKRTLILLLTSILLISLLGGCAAKPTPTDNLNPETPTPTGENDRSDQAGPPKGITVNKISFEVLKLDSLSKDKQDIINQLKAGKGFTYWEENDGYIIAIFSGEKPTSGHSIAVKSIEDNEGKTVIIVEETAPADMAATVISYPVVVIKAKQITNNFIVSDAKGIRFPNLILNDSSADEKKVEMVSGTFNGGIDSNSIEVKLDNGNLKVFTITEVADSFETIKENTKLKLIYYTNEYGQNIVTDIDFVE